MFILLNILNLNASRIIICTSWKNWKYNKGRIRPIHNRQKNRFYRLGRIITYKLSNLARILLYINRKIFK